MAKKSEEPVEEDLNECPDCGHDPEITSDEDAETCGCGCHAFATEPAPYDFPYHTEYPYGEVVYGIHRGDRAFALGRVLIAEHYVHIVDPAGAREDGFWACMSIPRDRVESVQSIPEEDYHAELNSGSMPRRQQALSKKNKGA